MSSYSFPESRRDTVIDCGEKCLHGKVLSTATAFPPLQVTNANIIANHGHGVSDAAMRKITGVSTRRVSGPGISDTDLLVEAARKCLSSANVRAEDLSKLLVTKFLGDRILPMTASLLQRKLGCKVAVQAYDIDAGIHGFITALDAAELCIGLGDGPILIVSGGVINRLVSRTDPRVAFQYGDGAAAVLLGTTEQRHILSTYSFTNCDYIESSVGMSIRKCLPSDIHETKNYGPLDTLYEQGDWKPGLDFVLEAVQHTVNELLTRARKLQRDVDFFLVTETHHRLWLAILERLGIEPSRTVSLLADFGNTMSAMLPMQLDAAIRMGRVSPGSLVMLLSIGEGMSGGGALLQL